MVHNILDLPIYGIGSASRITYACTDLACYSLTNFFFLFQLWHWIQVYTTKSLNLIIHSAIIGSTYKKGEFLEAKLECQHWATGMYFTIAWDTHGTRSGLDVVVVVVLVFWQFQSALTIYSSGLEWEWCAFIDAMAHGFKSLYMPGKTNKANTMNTGNCRVQSMERRPFTMQWAY